MVKRSTILFLLLFSCLAYGQRGSFTFHDVATMGRLHSIMHPAGGSGGSAGDYFNDTLIWIRNDFAAGEPFVYSLPYPSVINVTDLTGQMVTNATVTINGWNSSFYGSTHIDLYSPNTNRTIYLFDLDGGADGGNLTITLSDATTNTFHDSATVTNGTYKTSRHDAQNDFIDLAGLDANGDWGLAVYNSHPYSFAVSNYIATGWTLHLDTVPTNGITIALSDTNICFGTPALLDINVAGETAPYAVAVVSGSIPDGCFITSTNTIAGTPTNAGPFSFKLMATDDNGKPNFASFTAYVRGFLTTTLPVATVGSYYSNFVYTTFMGTSYFYVTSGSLPGGITLRGTDGLISGTATNSATNTFTLMVSNATTTCSKEFSIISSTNVTIVTGGLIHGLESDTFDTITNNAPVTFWGDMSGVGGANNWTAPGTAPTVDGIITAGGHKTVKFGSAAAILRASKFLTNGYSGLEIMAVFKLSADPPAGSSRMFVFNYSTDPSEQPYSDGNFYERFGRTTRPSSGNPTTNAASAFVCYDIASKADGTAYDLWLNADNFSHLTTGYTYQYTSSETYYFLGDGYANSFANGNLAAIYIWDHYLSDPDRTQMRTYINGKWGTLIP